MPIAPMTASAARRRRRRSEPGVAPRGAEGVEHVADAGPVRERADRRDTLGDQRARPEHHHHEEAEERDRGRGAHAVGHGVDRAARRVARACAGGCRCAGDEPTNAPSRAVVDTCSSRSSESCTVRRAWARRRDARSRRTWNRFEYQLPMAARGPARTADEQVAHGLDEPHDEPDRDQPEQLVQRVRREQHTHPRPRQRELVGPVVAQTVGRPPRGARRARRARRGPARRRAGRASTGRGPRRRGTSRDRTPRASVKRSARTSIDRGA